MAILQVQDSTTGSVANAGLITTTFGTTAPVVGDYIVVWTWGWNSGTKSASNVTCADNATGGSNTYTQQGYQSQAGDEWCCMFYAKVVNTKASLIVTVTDTDSPSGVMVAVATEFSGIAASSPVDGAAVGTTGTSTSPAPGNLTVTAGDLVSCVMVSDDSGNPATITVPSGFTNPDSANNPVTNGALECGGGAYKINPASPTNPTWTTGNFQWATSQFALKSAAGGATIVSGWEPQYPALVGDGRIIPVPY